MNRKTAISLFILILLSAFAAAFAADKTADSKLKFSTLKGTVKNTAQQPVEAAVVKLIDTEKGAVMSAKTGKDGSYVFEKAAAGRRYFIETEKTKDNMYLAGGLRKSFTADMKMQMIQDIEVSARPGEKADYVGTTVCLSCHMESSHDLTAGFMASAHQRVVHMGQDDIIEPAGGWGADNDPMGKKTGVMASPPDGSDSSPVTVTACTKDGVKGFAFGGAENEPCRTGVFIPIAATVGGQGDKYVAPGTDKPAANVGVFKQHFFAFLKNVPATSGPNWEMYPYPGAEQDFIMLPLYIAQSGNIAPQLR
ncbi:MAG: carboxypeptidase-like regulatory domain-containing protein, partial [Geovibrio sp.]|nr:carboxypeptidase-like regulatory domain-containing protein [Geovibrio sp.]